MSKRQAAQTHSSGSSVSDAGDLASLSGPTDESILSVLRDRFMVDAIYTRIGSGTIVALNPLKYIPANSDKVLHEYAQEYRDTDGALQRCPPHVFQIAADAYYYMRRTGRDGAIITSGETASGKTEMRRLSIKALIDLSLSAPGKKGYKLGDQIPNAEFVLESFGNARTLLNANASRFGKYTELQFTDRGRLAGAKTLDYYLERSRVVSPPAGERNFHVFYYLAAGASAEEREHLRLGDASAYRYTGGAVRRQSGPIIGSQGGEDAARFDQLKQAFKAVGFSKRHVAQICQLVAAILHLGNLDFVIDRARNADSAVVRNTDVLDIVADFLGVQSSALEAVLSYRTKLIKKEVCTVFLDVDGASANSDDLARSLYSLLFAWINEYINVRLCRDDFSTFIGILDLPGFQNHPSVGYRGNSLDQFCVNYANEKLQSWILRHVFERPAEEHKQEGLARLSPSVAYADFDNSETLRLLAARQGGLIHIMDDQSRRAPKKTDATMVEAFGKRWGNHPSFKVSAPDRSGFPTFTINHYAGTVNYSAESWIERNTDAINPDFVSLLRGGGGAGVESDVDAPGSANPFVKSLFSDKAIATQAHPKSDVTIVAAQQPVKPMRQPSTRRTGPSVRRPLGRRASEQGGLEDTPEEPAPAGDSGVRCIAGEFRFALDTLFATLDECQPWYIFCLSPNDAQLPNQLEARHVKAQIRSLALPAIAKRAAGGDWPVSMMHGEFVERYADELAEIGVMEGDAKERVVAVREKMGWAEKECAIGSYKVFLTHASFRHLEDHIRANDEEEQKRNRAKYKTEADYAAADPFSPYAAEPRSPAGSDAYGDPFASSHGHGGSSLALPLVAHAHGPHSPEDAYDDKSYRSEDDYAQSRFTQGYDESASNFGTESYAPSRNMFHNVEMKGARGGGAGGYEDEKAGEFAPQEGETAEEVKVTPLRKRWVAFCWLLTWWVPSPFLRWFGRMKRPDIRQAWREKLAINLVIWFICGCAVFVIAVLGNLICPRQHVFSSGELASHNFEDRPEKTFIAIRGEVFDLTGIWGTHYGSVPVVPQKEVMSYGGKDGSDLFPVQVSALCNGIDGYVSPFVGLDATNTSISAPDAKYHDFRAWTSDPRPDWYYEQMVMMRWRFRTGFLGYTTSEVKKMAKRGQNVVIYNDGIYDMTQYVDVGGGYVGHGEDYNSPSGVNTQFMDQSIVTLFKQNSGDDVTKLIDGLTLAPDVLDRQKTCLRNLFFIGKIDHRNSAQCQFSRYLLLALSILMVTVIGFKFLAALQFGSPRAPEDHDKFLICQCPCYTEGEESLRRTIDSLACLKYDDKRKLIFIICDGNIIGSGNDRTTPRIVLDILGADPNYDPEPLSFLSLGEGSKQHNMGKIYSGLYEVKGHVVPYIVLVKVGKPTERSRPGNRGKRDSQLALMHFLNKVHHDAPMNPLELEIYHQIKNVIGVNPSFYEYMLGVDADTTVDPLSATRMISSFIRDKKILALCGETSLSNAKQSIVTMAQVYEYYISHFLAKAFESLFGSVTCLPGCFSMYRLRTSDTHKPLFISSAVIDEYSENRVDTLHMKNLLHLGEDRYLTTLLLKHFPKFKTKFVRDAKAQTIAPDDFGVLLSQRRRWINSTVHNLAELIFLDKLCGFCCFSMRFMVFIDLLSTVIAPVTVAYIVYLIYLAAGEGETIPQTSIIMLCAIYGLQAMIFLLNRKWEHIGWMVVYICAIPLFSFFLPLYSFWHFDDFSWGSTRVVVGEKGKKLVIHDEGKFDPRVIPLKTWADYEAELWEHGDDYGSMAGWEKGSRPGSPAGTASLYGRQSTYGFEPPAFPRSRSGSPSFYAQGPAMRNSSYSAFGGYPPQAPYGRPSTLNPNYPPSQYGGYGMDPRGIQYQLPPSRPMSEFGADPNASAVPHAGAGPSAAELEAEIRAIISRSDWSTLTKKSVRAELADRFGNAPLAGRKAEISSLIDSVLASL